MRRPPKYTRGFVDRHGKPRWYYRRADHPSVALPGLPWSPEFMAAYDQATSGLPAERAAIGSGRTQPGTFDDLIVRFYDSTVFLGWAEETKRTRRNVLERFRADTMPGAKLNNGRCRVAHLMTKHADAMVAAKMATPFAAKNFRKTLHALMKFAVSEGYRKDNPVAASATPKVKSTEGFKSWGEEQIALFESHHAIGTRPRLALALLLYTAQRRRDVIRMGHQHLDGDLIEVRQHKTGTALKIPVHPALQSIIDATPRDNLTFLMTEFGRPFTSNGFGNAFRDWCVAAKLPKGFSAHGLRKAACRRLAEAGCSASQIMAISGHRSLAEAQKYVTAANQVTLARSAFKRTYAEGGNENGSGKPDDRVATQEKFS